MVKICDVVDGCEDCPKYGDDCDGDKLTEHTDLINRADAIEVVGKNFRRIDAIPISKEIRMAIIRLLKALPSADAVKVAYICDGRKCGEDCSDCFRTLDIEHAKDFKKMGGTYYQQESAEAVPTVIRAKTFMRKEDFDKWAEDIKRQNKSIVCIPADAEVVSADAVPQLRQTDTLIIADALRYLAKDTERHLVDRTRADALRQQFLKYGASMCKGGAE